MNNILNNLTNLFFFIHNLNLKTSLTRHLLKIEMKKLQENYFEIIYLLIMLKNISNYL